MSRLVLEPVRDLRTPHAPYAVRVRCDATAAVVYDVEPVVGWYPTLAEAIDAAVYEFPAAEVLEPAWEST